MRSVPSLQSLFVASTFRNGLGPILAPEREVWRRVQLGQTYWRKVFGNLMLLLPTIGCLRIGNERDLN